MSQILIKLFKLKLIIKNKKSLNKNKTPIKVINLVFKKLKSIKYIIVII